MSPAVEGELVLRSLATGQEQLVYRPPDGVEINSALLSGDGRQVVVQDWDLSRAIPHPHTRLRLVDLVTGRISVFAAHEGDPLGGLRGAPDKRHIVWTQFALPNKVLWVGDLQTGKVSILWTGPDIIFAPQCWSPDARRIVGVTLPTEGAAKMLTIGLPDGAARVLGAFADMDPPLAAYSPVADEMAYTTANVAGGRRLSTICIADASNGRLKRQFGPFDGRLGPLVWSPDGTMLAFSGEGAIEVLRVGEVGPPPE